MSHLSPLLLSGAPCPCSNDFHLHGYGIFFLVKPALPIRPRPYTVPLAMEASFWSSLEIHPQQTPLSIIALLISRRSVLDSVAHSLEVLHETPCTTDFPPDLPDDLQQILRDLHASTDRMFEEVRNTNRLLDRLALYPPHALPTQPWIPPRTSLPRYPAPFGPGPELYMDPDQPPPS